MPPRRAGSKPAAGRGGVTAAEVAAWADDLTSLGRDYFFSLNRYLFIASK
jgi:arsenite methyltransferase